MEETLLTLPGGLRMLHKPFPATRLTHCALVFDVGSRDESPEQYGMAHFLEHMVFKGTQKRKAFHILSRIDSVGGELNAFTTKEKTVYHATVTQEHTERAIELLFDIAFHSILPAKEIEKEKTVISEEIDMYQDDPEESIFEAFEEMVFGKHPLAHPVLGTKEGIRKFSHTRLRSFNRSHYTPERAVLAVFGAPTLDKTSRMALRHAESLPKLAGEAPVRKISHRFKPDTQVHEKPIQQAHFLLGGPAYPLQHKRFVAFLVLQHLLGGPHSNCRLNLNIREKFGLAYNIQSYYQPFVDGGVWGVYAGCEKKQLPRVISLVEKELRLLCNQPLSTVALARVKKQFIGAMLIGQESLFNQMVAQAKDVLDFGRTYSLDEAIRHVEALTSTDIQEAAEEYLERQKLSLLIYEPAES